MEGLTDLCCRKITLVTKGIMDLRRGRLKQGDSSWGEGSEVNCLPHVRDSRLKEEGHPSAYAVILRVPSRCPSCKCLEDKSSYGSRAHPFPFSGELPLPLFKAPGLC